MLINTIEHGYNHVIEYFLIFNAVRREKRK